MVWHLAMAVSCVYCIKRTSLSIYVWTDRSNFKSYIQYIHLSICYHSSYQLSIHDCMCASMYQPMYLSVCDYIDLSMYIWKCVCTRTYIHVLYIYIYNISHVFMFMYLWMHVCMDTSLPCRIGVAKSGLYERGG